MRPDIPDSAILRGFSSHHGTANATVPGSIRNARTAFQNSLVIPDGGLCVLRGAGTQRTDGAPASWLVEQRPVVAPIEGLACQTEREVSKRSWQGPDPIPAM